MTREEIGSYLGLKLETVSRTFSRFQDEGLLEVKQRQVRIARRRPAAPPGQRRRLLRTQLQPLRGLGQAPAALNRQWAAVHLEWRGGQQRRERPESDAAAQNTKNASV